MAKTIEVKLGLDPDIKQVWDLVDKDLACQLQIVRLLRSLVPQSAQAQSAADAAAADAAAAAAAAAQEAKPEVVLTEPSSPSAAPAPSKPPGT